MGKSILITGGARSGKSTLGETKAKEISEKILYVATSFISDSEMERRVEKHKERRLKTWGTHEGYLNIGKVIQENQCYDGVLIDCITTMVTNIIFNSKYFKADVFSLPDSKEARELQEKYIDDIDFFKIEEDVMSEIEALIKGIRNSNSTVIMITNELGSGVVPETRLGREFRDIAGRANQFIASCSEEVYLTVCGIPMKVK